jgi:RHS repeat-associated protein
VDEYDFGGTSLLKKTLTQYLTLNGFQTDKPTSIIVQDGQGNPISQTKMGYDETTPVSTSQYNVPNHSTEGAARGNLTSEQRWNNVNNNWLITSYQNDDTGNVLQVTDPIGHNTQYSYLDSWDNTTCQDNNGNTLAYLTKTTNALNQSTTSTYNSCSGTLASRTDPNGQTIGFSYDNMSRLVQTNFPDGGQVSACYTDEGGPTCSKTSAPFSKVASTKITPSQTKSETTSYDGYGRVTQTALTSDPDGTTYTALTYDSDSRILQTYNATRCNPPTKNCGESTWGYKTYAYDAMNRTTSITEQDGSSVSTAYSGVCKTVTDEAGKATKSCVNALGGVAQVFEDPASLNYETDYSYNVLGDLLSVTQKGGTSGSSQWRTRSFQYDSLSRLTQASNPESGTISYGYDGDSNITTKTAPAPNQTGGSTVTTTYSYDALNRLLNKTYAGVGATPADYAYDGASLSCPGPGPSISSPTNLVGRLSAMCSSTVASAWSYDPMGRPIAEKTNFSGNIAYQISYLYNLDGSLQKLTYPSGDVVSYTVGGAGRVTNVSDANNSYVAVPSSNPMYAPSGLIMGMKNGSSITTSNAYNSRLQPVTLSAQTTPATVFSLSYNFHATSGDNGNVYQIVDNLDSTRSVAFQYDSLNRIQQANTTTTTGPNCWGEVYTVDPWGNLTNRGGVSGMTGCTYEGLSAVASTKNQLSILSYDAAGNVTNDGNGNTPTYDGEDRIVTDEGVSYSYDADGKRTQKSSGTLYWYGLGGRVLAESNLSGTISEEYVFFNGQRLARVDRPSAAVHFYFSDHLGSTSVITDASGGVQAQYFYSPYGGNLASIGGDPNHYKFTAKERDSESNLDNFGARYYAATSGRFMSADPANLSVDFFVPQTWNRYSYVLNRPLTMVDNNGLWPWWFHNQIIEGAFPGLSKSDIAILEKASSDVDKDQSDWGSPKHGMSDGNWVSAGVNSPIMANDYIRSNEEKAAELQAQWVASGHTGFSPEALSAFGNALHTISDMTSPAHEGFQYWYGPWYKHPFSAAYHFSREGFYMSQWRKEWAEKDARNAFKKTFGVMKAFEALDGFVEHVSHTITYVKRVDPPPNPPPPPPPPPPTTPPDDK